MRQAGNLMTPHALLRRFARERDGVSAVEFAIMLPFMLSLSLGGVELGEGYSVQYKVTEAARTVTDLASQYSSIDSPTMSGILGASSTVISPYPTSNMVVTVTQVQVAANATTGAVNGWSCQYSNGTVTKGYAVNSSIAVPTNLQNPPTTINLIYGEVSYPFTPTLGYAITGTISMYQNDWFYPRLAASIGGSPC
jgi:Flp pilus assembly protein TadG